MNFTDGLAQGKAMVATSVTLQGVEQVAKSAVEVADLPEAFAARVSALLGDEALRRSKASLALGVAREHFSPEACYREFLKLAVS